MLNLRESTFETNSSSCHCLTTISKDELLDFSHDQCNKCIYLPDTGEYQTGNKYKIMTIEEAFNQYNHDHLEYNLQLGPTREDLKTKIYEDDEEFENDLEHGWVAEDIGKYMTFADLMSHIIVDNDCDFDVIWWNNN